MLTLDEPPTNLLFDYPCADLILRSKDSHHFRVPKCYIVNSSPVLAELIQKTLVPPGAAHAKGSSLPVVRLPKSEAILHSLLTFVFPRNPLSYHPPLKRPWSSSLWPKGIRWAPCYRTSGASSLERVYYPLVQRPHSTPMSSLKNMDFVKKRSKPHKSLYRTIRSPLMSWTISLTLFLGLHFMNTGSIMRVFGRFLRPTLRNLGRPVRAAH